MAWLLLLVAGGLEVVFATSLDRSAGFSRLEPSITTVVVGVAAVIVLGRALLHVPISTGYAAFTALGTLGTTALATVRGEQLGAMRLAGIALVVAGVGLLHLATTPT